MTSTGVHSPEQSLRRASGWLSPCLRAGVCGLALTAGILGTNSSASAGHADLTKPRVEKVRDVDGSVWEVLIVPRPLYHSGPIPCQPGCEPASPNDAAVIPPAPKNDPKPKAQPKAKAKAKPTKPAYEAQPKNAAPSPPPPPQKRSPKKEQAGHRPRPTERVSLDDKDKQKSESKKKADAAAPKADQELGVEIVPRFSYPIASPAAACCPSDPRRVQVHPGDYRLVYQSIPFLRSEYIANPSYRHEATMEILFGQLRPAAVKKRPAQPRPHHTLFPFENNAIRPNSYYSLGGGPGPGPGYGQSPGPGPVPFGVPGAYGRNLNYPGAQLSRVPWGFTIPYDLTPGY